MATCPYCFDPNVMQCMLCPHKPARFDCPQCGQRMLPINYGGSIYEWGTCRITVTLKLTIQPPSITFTTIGEPFVDPLTQQRDCRTCNHSWYDHIGWRRDTQHATGCRIVRCECEAYEPRYF